jgi:hypothetical protein
LSACGHGVCIRFLHRFQMDNHVAVLPWVLCRCQHL